MTPPALIADPPGRLQRHRRRSWRRTLAVLTGSVFVLVAGGGAVGPSAAAAAAAPRAHTAAAVVTTASLTARAPFGDYVDRLSFDVASIDPALVTAGGPATLNITGTMTNAGPEALTNLSYRFQRGEALATEADVRQELTEPSEPNEQIQDDFTPSTRELAAGASVPFVFSAGITATAGLNVDAPGVYPLMVNVNGAVTLEGGPLEARIGELHLLLTVMGVPGDQAAPVDPEPGNETDVGNITARPLPVNFVWPLVDRPHLGVGGVFLDDDLAAAVAPGGRLSILLDGLTGAAASRLPAGAVTVVVDPQLLDELDRMSGDYRIVSPAGEPQPPVTVLLDAAASAGATTTGPPAATPTVPATPTPTAAPSTAATGAAQTDALPTAALQTDPLATGGAAPSTANPLDATGGTAASTSASAPGFPDIGGVDVPGTIAGTGQAAAASYLGRLRDVAARYPVVVLPYGDADVVALTRAGLSAEVTTAVQHGREVAARVLGNGTATADGGSTVNTTMAYPIDGAANGETLAALGADGLRTALLSESSVEIDGSRVGAAVVAVPGESNPPMPAVIAQPDVLSGFDDLIDRGRQSGWATRVNALTGVLAQQSLDGTVTPAVFTPDRRWSPDAPGLQVITDLLGTLGESQVISGIELPALAAAASTAAAAAYPEQAERRELSTAYLDRISAGRAEVASLRESFAATRQPSDPNLVLDPLDVALDAAASTAFRSDPAVGEENLREVEATTGGLRTGVEISSAGNSYTLASSTSPLVLTVQNNLPYDVPVRVQISGGERVGLTVSDPGIQVVPAGRSQQVRIPAEVSRSGQFQVSAQLVGADGAAWGPPVQLSVDSTAYGALTVILIVGAGGVLVLMVALRIVQRLRGRDDPTGEATQIRVRDRNHDDDRLDPAEPEADGPGTEGPETDRSALRDVIPTTGTPSSTAGRHPAGQNPTVPAEQVGTDRS